MNKFSKTTLALALAASLTSGVAMAQTKNLADVKVKSADEVDGTRLGLMECTIDGGVGLLIGSKKDANCTFTHEDGTVEEYTGSMNKLGLDIGISGESFIKWVVFTPVGNKVGDYALEGNYVGVSADASLGIGLGANALVGGSNRQIGLQPFSFQSKKGVNVAVALTNLELVANRN